VWIEYGMLALGGFVGAAVIGSAGFGFALVAGAVWLQVLPPLRVVPLVALCAIALNCYLVWHHRRDLQFSKLTPFVVGGLLGVPLGAGLLGMLDAAEIRRAVGVILIAYGCYTLALPGFAPLQLRPSAAAIGDGCAGWLGGVMGGATSLNGIVPTLWGQLRGFKRSEQFGVLQPYFLLMHFYTLVWLGANPAVSKTLLRDAALCAPAIAVGSLVAAWASRYVSQTGFRRFVQFLFLVMGLSLLR